MGGTRIPGPEGVRGPDAAIEDGTLSRQRAPFPGATGSKGGHAKQAGRIDEREMFLDEIRGALPGTTIAPGQLPDETLMTAFFRSTYITSQSPSRQCSVFHRYANLYYIHIYEVDPTGDVTYPGTYCDAWGDLTDDPPRGGRHVIDCEGYAYLATVLLGAAAWTSPCFRLAHAREDPSDFHIAAQLTLGGTTAYVGGPRPTVTSMFNECRRAFQGTPFNILDDEFQTQQDAHRRTEEMTGGEELRG